VSSDSPLCGDPARYDRGECNWPKCGCKIEGDTPTESVSAHGRLNRFAIAEAADQLDRLLNLVTMPDHIAFNVRGTMYLLRHEMERTITNG